MRLNSFLNMGFRSHPLAHAIQWERHHLFMREVGGRMVASVIVAFLVGLLFIDSASQTALAVWFAAAGFVSLNSFLIIRYYNRCVGIERPDYFHDSLETKRARLRVARRWHVINLYQSIIWGIFWALSPFLFFPDASVVQVYSLLLLVVVMSSMPSISMGCYPDIYLAFLAPVLGAFSWQLMSIELDGGWVHKVVGPLTWISLVAYSLAIFKTQIRFIILRLEHQQAQREAADASQAKTRFLAAASHDLRQPLQAARLYMHALMQRSDVLVEGDQMLLERVNLGLNNANELLDRLLDVSRLDADNVPVNITTFDACALGQELIELLYPKAEDKSLTLRFRRPDTPCLITTDRVLLARIVRNLLENALLYTKEGEVTLVMQRINNQLRVEVQDTGVGIPYDRQQEIFEEFTRLHSSDDGSTPGIGLGLPIVQRLCQLLEIRLSLQSQVGQGTCFGLNMPLAEADAIAAMEQAASLEAISESEPADEHGLHDRVLMVVDDQEEILDAISMTLIPYGCDVWVAQSVDEAVEQIRQHQLSLDALISDDHLGPHTLSDDVIQAVQALQGQPVPVCVLTGSTAPQRVRALGESGHTILHKPVAPEQLVNTLTGMLRSA
ncbi:MAG: hybrid sensor histidine kinase/response regulator [Oceanobacter sp.]